MYININKILNKLIFNKSNTENLDENKQNSISLSKTDDKNDELINDEPTIEELFSYFENGERKKLPLSSQNRDICLKKAQKVYNEIGIENYIKSIRIEELDFGTSGEVNTNVIEGSNEIEVIVSIAPYVLGINNDGYVRSLNHQQIEKFIDVLSHELFHAKNNIDILKHVGANEYTHICNNQDFWFKLARIMFDEYYACRKNAECYNSFSSVEVGRNIETNFSSLKYCYAALYIRTLFYSTATLSAFADVSKEQEEIVLRTLKTSKKIFQDIRSVFNDFYLKVPLDYNLYLNMGYKLEEIYNFHRLCKPN